MWVLDILNLNQRKLNHHEEVYSQIAIWELLLIVFSEAKLLNE